MLALLFTVYTAIAAPELNPQTSTVAVTYGKGYGSGIIIAPRIVLTAAHMCVSMKEPGMVTVYNHNKQKNAKVTKIIMDKRAPSVDLCVLYLEQPVDGSSVAVISAKDVSIKQEVVAHSFSGNLAYSSRYGFITGFQGYEASQPLAPLTVTANLPIEPGGSGGGVYDFNTNELVGVIMYQTISNGFVGFVNIKQVREFIHGELELK